MIIARTVLILVCTSFSVLMNGCFFGSADNGCVATEEVYCNDSTIVTFTPSTTAKNWLFVDSLAQTNLTFISNSGAEINMYVSKFKRLVPIQISSYNKVINDKCVDNFNCPIRVKYNNYELSYNAANYGFSLYFKLNRDTAQNLFDTNPDNWREYLSVNNGSFKLNFIPNENLIGLANTQNIPSMVINNKTYTNVQHVYDSSLVNSNYIRVMGIYYSAEQGLLRYYLNRYNEVWSLK